MHEIDSYLERTGLRELHGKITEASQFATAPREPFGIRVDPTKESRLAAMVVEENR